MRDQARLGVPRQWSYSPKGMMQASIRVAHLLGLSPRTRRITSESGVPPANRTTAHGPMAQVRDGDVKTPKSRAGTAKSLSAGPKRRKANARKPLPNYSALVQLALSTVSPPSLSKAETRASWDRAFRRARLGPAALATWTNSVPSKCQSESDRSWDDAFRKAARR